MNALRDYECPKHGTFETWGSEDSHPCPRCRKPSPQVIGCRGIVLPFYDEGFPSAWHKWADNHERAARRPENPDVDELGY